MKKILLSAYCCDPSKGSENANGWNWAKELALLGFDVHILTTSDGKESIEKQIILENHKNLFFHYVDHNSFWKQAFYWNFVFMYFAYFLWQYKIYLFAKKLHILNAFTIVHHVTWGSIKVGSFLYKLQNTKFIFGPLGGGHKADIKYKKYFYGEWNKEAFRNIVSEYIAFINPLTKLTLQNASVVLVTNEDTFEFAKKNGATQVELVIDSALPSIFMRNEIVKKKSIDEKFRLLWVGRLYSFKGLGLVIEAISKIQPDLRKNIELNIVGDGPFKIILLKLVDEFGLSNNVVYHGSIPFKDVSEKYIQADAFIFCSLRDSCPAQHLEAMSFGLPVITLDLHGSKLIVPDNAGFKIPVDSPSKTIVGITEAIIELSTNVKLRKELGGNGFEYAQDSTWSQKVFKIVSQFY